jgi:3-hydroxybutyryl-CoA dehydrogenase
MTKVSIIGFGTMGIGLAQLFAQKGYLVRAIDMDEEALARGKEFILSGRFGLNRLVKDGRISETDAKDAFNRIETGTDLQWCLDESEIVVENVDENLELKKSVFQQLDQLCDKNVILASDTSSLSVSSIASKTRIPERVVGMHFFVPPQVMPLVEIISGIMTSKETVSKIEELSKNLGKVTILSGDRPGFVVARLSLRLFVEASSIVEQGVASVKDVDLGVKKGLGFPMGPFELTDLIGLDTRLEILESIFDATGDLDWKPPLLLRQLVESGFLGDPSIKKGSKGGFYDYFRLGNKVE